MFYVERADFYAFEGVPYVKIRYKVFYAFNKFSRINFDLGARLLSDFFDHLGFLIRTDKRVN
jgi:hypothetical protein